MERIHKNYTSYKNMFLGLSELKKKKKQKNSNLSISWGAAILNFINKRLPIEAPIIPEIKCVRQNIQKNIPSDSFIYACCTCYFIPVAAKIKFSSRGIT